MVPHGVAREPSEHLPGPEVGGWDGGFDGGLVGGLDGGLGLLGGGGLPLSQSLQRFPRIVGKLVMPRALHSALGF